MMNNKKQLRDHFRKIRKQIDKCRRDEAKKEVFSYLKEKLKKAKSVLSYIPFEDEVDVSLMNEELVARGALILPRIEEHGMKLYLMTNGKMAILKGELGFPEPDPKIYHQIQNCDVALIPGIAFDSNKNRIGYGYGYFDRLLKANPSIYKIGIGFREQLSPEIFQTDDHDVPMDELCIV